MKLLTGNDLLNGRVLWWTGHDWSPHIRDAVDAGASADAILAAEQAARRINAAYAIDADDSDDGPVPAHIKERIRAIGPSVRADLGIRAADPSIGSWEI